MRPPSHPPSFLPPTPTPLLLPCLSLSFPPCLPPDFLLLCTLAQPPCTCAHTHARARAHAHARTRTRAHARTNAHICTYRDISLHIFYISLNARCATWHAHACVHGLFTSTSLHATHARAYTHTHAQTHAHTPGVLLGVFVCAHSVDVSLHTHAHARTHARQVCHRDLRVENIMLDNRGNLKVS
jgi:hypothetical protein